MKMPWLPISTTSNPASPASHLAADTANFASPALTTRTMRLDHNITDEPGPSRRKTRHGDEELYDPSKPVLLHEGIVDGSVATSEVLEGFGFALGDTGADIWFHPHSQFQCRSAGEQCCKWERNTILRCSVTTEITREDDTMGLVKDLDSLGSLYHPPCINRDCNLNLKPRHIMRIEKKQLVSRALSDPEKDAMAKRKRNKWFGKYQDEYPMRVGVMPFSRNPNDEPIRKKRKCRPSSTNPSCSVPTHPLDPQSSLPISPVSQPASPATETSWQRNTTVEAGPSRPRAREIFAHAGSQSIDRRSYEDTPSAGHESSRSRTGTEVAPKVEARESELQLETSHGQTSTPSEANHDQSPDVKPILEESAHRPRSRTLSPYSTPHAPDDETDAEWQPNTTRVTDQYLISRRDFDRMRAESNSLRARVAELEREAEESRSNAQQAAERENEVRRLAQDEKTGLEERVRAAEQETDRQKTLTKAYKEEAQRALNGVRAMGKRIEGYETKASAAKLGNDTLKKANRDLRKERDDLKEEVRSANEKVKELKAKARELFGVE